MNTSPRVCALLLMACGCVLLPALGQTINLTPGSTLRIDFTSDPVAQPCPSTCDVLNLSLVLALGSQEPPGTLATASTYSGAALLGTATNDPAAGLAFRSAASAYQLGTTIPFGAFQGLFSGYLLVTATNVLSIDGALTNVDLGSATGPGGFDYNPQTVQISSVTLVPAASYLVVPIEIKPGSSPAPVNTKEEGKIPVAVLSDAAFNAPGSVDRLSLKFGRTGTEDSLAFCDSGATDVNGDGLADLVCHFDAQRAGFQAGDTAGYLTGKTLLGVPIKGSAPIRVVK